MKHRLPCLLYCISVAGWPVPGLSVGLADGGGDHPVLHHNPFQRPQPSALVTAEGMASPERPLRRKTPPPQLELRATLLSNRTPLVNVDGHILAIGDEIEGYRLTRITEGTAVFTSGQRRLTLTIDSRDLDQEP